MKSCSEYCCVINQHNQLKLYCSSALSVADSSLDQPNPTDRTIPVGQNVSHIQKDIKDSHVQEFLHYLHEDQNFHLSTIINTNTDT